MAEYNKKLNEVKYLQTIFDGLGMVLGNVDMSKKSVGDGIRSGIIELQRELAKAKSENMQLKE